MAYPIYSNQQLRLKSIARLKEIYREIGASVEVTDKRCRDAWIAAITEHQASKIQKVDEQTQAQLELDQYIVAQGNDIAPQPLKKLEINFYHHEVYAGEELIAQITYDRSDFTTQPWLVIVDDVEKFRAATPAKCDRYIEWHHKDGTLRETAPTPLEFPEISPEVQVVHQPQNTTWRQAEEQGSRGAEEKLIQVLSPLPLRPSAPLLTTMQSLPGKPFVDECHNFKQQPCAITEEIACECKKYGFKLYNGKDIYKNRTKIGEVTFSEGNWWVQGATQPNQKRLLCDSLADAVWWLSTRNFQPTPIAYRQQILHKPLEQLTAADWRWLQQHEIVTQLVAV